MRVAILAHSFQIAFRVFKEVRLVPECECFMVISPSPRRSTLISITANVARITRSLATDVLRPLPLLLSHRVVMLRHSFDHPASVSRLRGLELDIGLHQAGIIYRNETIGAFRLGILNAHIGLLPAYRGRSVMEWSLLQGDPTGISVFFIDEGIDTGARIVVSEEVSISHCKSLFSAKQYLFDLSGLFFRKALTKLAANEPDAKVNDASGRRYYVISTLFSEVAERVLVGNN